MPGIKLVAVADIEADKARKNCVRAGWTEAQLVTCSSAGAVNDASRKGNIALVEDADNLLKADLDVVLEVTGVSEAGVYHAWTAFDYGKHVVMVTVESDSLVGMALKDKADEKGLVYSIAYGDEPGCTFEVIDWARTCGFEVVCGGKCVAFLPGNKYSTPETGWKIYGLSEAQLATGDFNKKMYNSFADGTKTAVEMSAVANACNLMLQKAGLTYPPVEYEQMPEMLKPKSEGGILEHGSTVEVLSSLKRDGTPLQRTVKWGVFVTFKARSEFVHHFMRDFHKEHRIIADKSSRYSVLYRPTHIIGLELGISVASVGLFGMPTGTPTAFVADVTTAAKKDLKPGEILDGEGGYAAYGKLVRAEDSLRGGYLPIGLSNQAKLKKAVPKDGIVTYEAVALDENSLSYKLRKIIEQKYRPTS